MKNKKILLSIAITFTLALIACESFGLHVTNLFASLFTSDSGFTTATIVTLCAKIDGDLDINCANPIQAGTRDEAYIFNFDDFSNAALTRNGPNPQIIENIVLNSGVHGYAIQGINNSNEPKNSYVKSKFSGSFDHEFGFKVFSLNPTIKALLEKTSKGRFVVIVQNNYKGDTGESAYEIYGLDSGLVLEKLERDPTNQDTQGAYDVLLKSSALSKEAHLPASIYKTSYAVTKAIVEGLIA